ncbi:hypothetical protein B9Z19DRAFT_972688, partial [Tuber borchii]
LRFTGGRICDKLRSIRRLDICLRVKNMSWGNFAAQFSEPIPKNMEKCSLEPHSVSKMKINAEKSKHLETATTNILDIGFVILRSVRYPENSRTWNSRTPEKDTLHRDFPVNALFFNLPTELVQEFTVFGLQEIAAHIIRTQTRTKETSTSPSSTGKAQCVTKTISAIPWWESRDRQRCCKGFICGGRIRSVA